MLIRPGSPLRGVPASLDAEKVFALDGLRSAIDAATLSFTRLRGALLTFSTVDAPLETDAPVVAIADAWATVDALHRLADLVSFTLRKLDPDMRDPWADLDALRPAFRAFLSAARPARPLRNGFHHLPSKLNLAVAAAQPIMGVLRWLYADRESAAKGKARWLVYVSGSIDKADVALGLDALPGAFTLPVGHISISAFGNKLDISSACESIPDLIEELETQLRPRFAGHLVRPCGILASANLSKRPVSAPASRATPGRVGIRNRIVLRPREGTGKAVAPPHLVPRRRDHDWLNLG